MFSMSVTKSNDIRDGFKKSLEDINKRVLPAMVAVGRKLLEESNKLVPVLTGALKKSGAVEYKGSGVDTVVIVGYSVDYAIYVHEDMTKHHDNGQAKFLYTAIMEHQDELGLTLIRNL